jgi:hypothetical protein
MKLHKAVLDITAHLVHLNSIVCGKVTQHLPVIFRIKTSLHHMVEMRRLSERLFRRIYRECLLRRLLNS